MSRTSALCNTPLSGPQRADSIIMVRFRDKLALILRATKTWHLLALFQPELHELHGGEMNRDMVQSIDMWEVYMKLEARASSYIFNFVVYSVFWALMMTVIYQMPSSTMVLKQMEAIQDLLFDEEFADANYKKNFYEIMVMEEMWSWVDGPLTHAIFPCVSDDRVLNQAEDNPCDVGHRPSEIPLPLLGSNWLLGSVRVRQVRVMQQECISAEEDHHVLDPSRLTCYPNWDPVYESKESFGDENEYTYTADLGSALRGSNVLVTNMLGLAGAKGYGSGGFSLLLPQERAKWVERVGALKRDFIDLQTRGVAFELNLYNGNDFSESGKYEATASDDDQVIVVQAVFQIEASGHMEKHIRITPVRTICAQKLNFLARKHSFCIDTAFF